MLVKRRQNLAETDRRSYYKEEQLEEFLDSKGAFYNVNESDNDDESFANNCCKIVMPILLQKLIDDFAVCKQNIFTC